MTILKKEEVMKMLRISKNTFDALLDSGALPYIQYVPKGRRYVTLEAVDEFIAASTKKSAR